MAGTGAPSHPGVQAADHRRRELAIALFRHRQMGSVRRADLETLDHALARAYADKTGKTLTRDLHDLADKDLIRTVSKGRYRASDELILGLMPRRAQVG